MHRTSLKIEESIFVETERIRAELNTSRNRYINQALAHYNKLKHRQILAERLKAESKLVKGDSISVLKEFEDMDYGN
jgi:hypothetical protein